MTRFDQQVVADYVAMLRIRLTEEAILGLRMSGAIVGSVHLSPRRSRRRSLEVLR